MFGFGFSLYSNCTHDSIDSFRVFKVSNDFICQSNVGKHADTDIAITARCIYVLTYAVKISVKNTRLN